MKNIFSKLSHFGLTKIVDARRRFNRCICSKNKNNFPPIIALSDPYFNVFFGYYDISPFDYYGKRILAIKTPRIKRPPLQNEIAKLGFFEIESKKFFEFGKTETWCWQQGCRLQWFNAFASNVLVLYNCLINGDYGAIIQNIETGERICEFRKPIYSLAPNCKWGLSLNFSRLQRLRPGYGYTNLSDGTLNIREPESDGIWLINLENGEEELLFSIKEVATRERLDEMNTAEHYFNHICFAPDSETFLFFHLWQNKDKRRSRLVVSNIKKNFIQIFWNDYNVSHYSWENPQKILLTGTDQRHGFDYRLLDLKYKTFEKVGSNKLTRDGHPSFFSSGNKILTDSYPDKFGERKLLIYDCNTNETTILASLYEPAIFTGEIRCDLHPRLSKDEKRVNFDFIQHGKRAMGIIGI